MNEISYRVLVLYIGKGIFSKERSEVLEILELGRSAQAHSQSAIFGFLGFLGVLERFRASYEEHGF